MPDVVGRCSNLGVRFLIQAQAGSDPKFDIKKLTALSGLPNVIVREGTLSRDEFYEAMIGSVALLPYWPRSYSWEDSSVYHEAKLLDVPVLVTAEHGWPMRCDRPATGSSSKTSRPRPSPTASLGRAANCPHFAPMRRTWATRFARPRASRAALRLLPARSKPLKS